MPKNVVADAEVIHKLSEMIKDVKFAMLTTAHPDGSLHSRPMATQQRDFDGDLWFFTSLSSEKVADMKQDTNVNLSYADPGDNRYISVSGKAEVVQDRAKAEELWNPLYKAWFPKGLDDPELCLIKVDVTTAEYWDSPSSKMVQLYGYVKAVVTGTRPEVGENKSVNLESGKPAA